MSLSFEPVSDSDLETEHFSNVVVANQLCGERTLGFYSDGLASYSVDGGPWISYDSTITRGQSVQIRMASPPTFGTTHIARLTIGQVNCYPDFLGGRICILEGQASEFQISTSPGSAADAPTVSVTYPLDGQEVNASSLTVEGTAADPDGVQEVHVNGVLANTSDGFASWQAEIPLISGLNELLVSSADSLLNRQPNAAVLSVDNTRSVFQAAKAIEMLPGSRMLYVIDTAFGGLIAVNTQSDQWSVLSSDADTSLPFIRPRRLLVDEAGARAWVIDRGYSEILQIDFSDGTRRLLTGAGESLEDARDLALDAARNQLLVLAEDLGLTTSQTIVSGRIVALNLESGVRQRLSDNSMPPGEPDFFDTYQVHFDTAGDRLILVEQDNVVDIDPVTGARQSIWKGNMDFPSSDLDELGGRLIVAREGLTGFIEIDLATGLHSDLIRLRRPNQLEYDDFNNRIFYTNGNHVGLIDLATAEEIDDYY